MSEQETTRTIRPRVTERYEALHPLTKRIFVCTVAAVMMAILVVVVAVHDGYSLKYAMENATGWFFIVLVGFGLPSIITYPLSEEYADRFVEAHKND